VPLTGFGSEGLPRLKFFIMAGGKNSGYVPGVIGTTKERACPCWKGELGRWRVQDFFKTERVQPSGAVKTLGHLDLENTLKKGQGLLSSASGTKRDLNGTRVLGPALKKRINPELKKEAQGEMQRAVS